MYENKQNRVKYDHLALSIPWGVSPEYDGPGSQIVP